MQERENIVYGKRGDDFKNLIERIFKMGKIKDKYIEKLVNEENLKLYDIAFTSKEANPDNNYEFYEILGDATLGNFIIHYSARRFPELNNAEGVKILSNIKAEYGKKQFLAEQAEKFNFFEFITATVGEKLNPLEKKRSEKTRKDLLEDTFESFIGVTVYILDNEYMIGVGYAIAYNFLKEIYDTINIKTDFESLQSYITRIKEFYDKPVYKSIGSIIYETNKDISQILTTSEVFFVSSINGKRIKLGTATAALKKAASEKAAENAFDYIKKKGWTRDTAFDNETLKFLSNK